MKGNKPSDGQAILANISGQGRGGWEGVATPLLEILTIACLTFCLLLTDRPTLGLPEYKLKLVNICKMHGTGVLKLWCYALFDRFQQYVEIVRKRNEIIRPFNYFKSTGSVLKHRGNTTVSNLCLLLLIYYDFWPQNGSKFFMVPSLQLKFDDSTVSLSFIVLSQFLFTNSS